MEKTKSQTHVYFMSRPTTKPTDPRSYLVKRPGEFYANVRVVPTGKSRAFQCVDCKSGECKHAAAVAKIDFNKFPKTENEK